MTLLLFPGFLLVLSREELGEMNLCHLVPNQKAVLFYFKARFLGWLFSEREVGKASYFSLPLEMEVIHP